MTDNELKPCPVCFSKAFVHRNIVDGSFFGYSVGCPKYRRNDGIHGVGFDEPYDGRDYTIHYLNSKEEAIKAWNRRFE